MVPTPMLRARALLILPLALAAVGCEEEGGAQTCDLSCDDGDFCTEDRCDPTLDRCVHVPRDAANACTLDRHCDDGDPCTTDSCGVDPLCSLQRCVHEFVPGCRSCANFGSCDDGNACTVESCGDDLLCRYTEQDFCDAHCRMWTMGFYQPSNVAAGAASVWGRVEPRSGASCIEGCACTADLVLTDGAGVVRLMPGQTEGDYACAISGVCDGPTVVACDPLIRGREYIVWGTAEASRDAAGAAPIPSDTSASVDVGLPWSAADRVTVDGFCMAPTPQGVAGRYDATLELDDDPPVTFGVTLTSDGTLTIDASTVTDAQSNGYEAWSGASIGFYFVVQRVRTLRADLYPGEDRLVGWVLDPSQPATDAKPGGGGAQIPAEPPPPESFGARVGKLTLVLVP